MNKVIHIQPNRIGRYADSSPCILAEDLTLSFHGLTAANGAYYAVVTNNGYSFRSRIAGDLTLPLKELTAGELNVGVVYYLKGNKLAEYSVEPLLLKGIETNLSAEPEISSLRHETETLKGQLTALEHAVSAQFSALSEKEAELEKQIKLMKGGYDPLRV